MRARHGLIALSALCGILGALFLAGVSTPSADSSAHMPAIDPGRPAPGATSLYDSIRTDLSDYLWPTDAGRSITSTFGEFRRTHFHAGLDISTHDRTGYRTFASRDGYVSRIRVSPDGYGKILFLSHPDRYTTTYAHLAAFSRAIEARVRQEQQRLGCYPVDIACGPGEFPVRKGDLIAYTGETGAGDPHLHFEIRDEHDNAVNPLLCLAPEVVDNIPPAFNAIALVPIGEGSAIDGRAEPRTYRARAISARSMFIPEKIRVTGHFGVAVNVRDRSNGTWFRHGVYAHRLYVDDSLILSVRLDRVPVHAGHQIGFYYSRELLERRKGRYEQLFVDAVQDLPIYVPGELGAGVLSSASLAEGLHSLRVQSEDFHGNVSEITATLDVRRRPEVTLAVQGEDLVIASPPEAPAARLIVETGWFGKAEWKRQTIVPGAGFLGEGTRFAIDPERCDVIRVTGESPMGALSEPVFHLVRTPAGPPREVACRVTAEDTVVCLEVSSTGVLSSPPRVTLEEGALRRTVQMRRVDLHRFTGRISPDPRVGGRREVIVEAAANGWPTGTQASFEVYPILPQQRGSHTIDGGKLLVGYDSSSVYSRLDLRFERLGTDEEPVYELLPRRHILRGALRVTVLPDRNAQGQGLYALGSQRPRLLGHPGGDGSPGVSGRLTRELWPIAIMSDVTPPHVSNVRIAVRGARKPRIAFSYGDDLSGVDYQSMKVYIDTTLCIAEIDGEHRRASYEHSDALERGPHRLTIHLKDNLGNASVTERQFVVR